MAPGQEKKDKEKDKESERRERRESRIASVTASVSALKTAEASGKSGKSELDEKFEKFQNEMRSLFQKLDDSIDEKINKLDDKFSNRFEELKTEIGTLKADIEVNTVDIGAINETLAEQEKAIEFNNNQIIESDEKRRKDIKKLEKSVDDKIKLLDQKLMLLEKHDRKYNLLIYGINEDAGEKLYDKMRRFFVNDLGIEEERAQRIHFVNGHRYPTKSSGPNPIILRFSCWDDRELVLSQAKNLLNTRKRILTDLPVPMKLERDRLAKAAFKIRKENGLQTRIRDKGLDLYLEVRKDRKDNWVRRVVNTEEETE